MLGFTSVDLSNTGPIRLLEAVNYNRSVVLLDSSATAFTVGFSEADVTSPSTGASLAVVRAETAYPPGMLLPAGKELWASISTAPVANLFVTLSHGLGSVPTP